MSKIRILIADDHPLMRAGIVQTIKNESDMEIVAIAEDGDHAIKLFAQTNPDVCLIDLRMPGRDGVYVIHWMRSQQPATKTIVLTASTTGVAIQRVLEAGASSVLLKHMCRENLVETIRAVHRGERPMLDDIAKIIAEHALGETLTVRETEVLRLISQGNSNRGVSELLGISEFTVKGHVKSIMLKLGANDRTHAVTIALQRGFLSGNE